jgi:hypothetical protein
MHLTNYAINKTNPEFKQNKGNTGDANDSQAGEGHKRSLRWTFAYLAKHGHNVAKLQL